MYERPQQALCMDCNKHAKLYNISEVAEYFCFRCAGIRIKAQKEYEQSDRYKKYADCKHINTYHGVCMNCGEQVY